VTIVVDGRTYTVTTEEQLTLLLLALSTAAAFRKAA
jgi:hypothetical protein